MGNSHVTEYVVAFMVLSLLVYALKLFHKSYVENARVILKMSVSLGRHIKKEQELTNQLNAIINDTNNRVRKIGESSYVRNKNSDNRRSS